MSRERQRLLTEGVVIVGSILLAFAIDAAWGARGERQRLDRLTMSLRADVEATREAILTRIAWAEGVTQRSHAILTGIAQGTEGPALDSLVFSVGNVFVKGRWAPINYSYEQALGSGDLTLIKDPELRLLLGRYSESLDNVTARQESVLTQYYGELEPFLVAYTDYSQVAWDGEAGGLVRGPFSTNAADLASQRRFFNLLNLKTELELEMVNGLEASLRLADELLEKLGRS